MIYLSSSCFKERNLKKNLEACLDYQSKNIELSGNLFYEKNFINILLDYKRKYSMNFLLHNYSPPPKKKFVINLSSLNDEIYEMSINHCVNSIKLSKILKAKKYSVHTGFFLDPIAKDLGKKLQKTDLNKVKSSIKRFCNSIILLNNEAKKNNVTIYFENNVISNENYKTFNKIIPFLFVNKNDFDLYLKKLHIPPLLDIGHLKVSCKTLRCNFLENLLYLSSFTDYFHISDNNGKNDENRSIRKNTNFLKYLKMINLKNSTITLEISEEYNLLKSKEIISNLI